MFKKLSMIAAIALVAVMSVVMPVFAQSNSGQQTLNYHDNNGSVWVVNGQLYVHGVSLGVAKGNSWYVQPGTGCTDTYNSDSSTGKSFSTAFCTVGYALARASSYDMIWVSSANQEVVESVTISKALSHVRIIGAGETARGAKWKSASSSAPAITVNAEGVAIANLYFDVPTASSAVQLNRSVGQTTANANGAKVYGCEFWTGQWGVELNGAPHDVKIKANTFQNLRSATGTGIKVSATADSLPFRAQINGNYFSGNINHLVGAFSDSLITDNVFLSAATGATTTVKIDLRGGSNNAVNKNIVGGTYSNAGNYFAGTADEWVGNFQTSGLTTANPS